MMNKETAINLFDRNSCLIEDRDVILEDIAEKLTSRQAVKFAKRMNPSGHNGYGIGDYMVTYMTLKCFLLAVTYENINEYRKAGVTYGND